MSEAESSLRPKPSREKSLVEAMVCGGVVVGWGECIAVLKFWWLVGK